MNTTFDWRAFLEFAKKVYCDNENTKNIDNDMEALCRIAISRAYYAAYHVSKKFLITLDSNFQENVAGGSHESVIKAFLARIDNKFHRKIGRLLSYLKEQRVRADYISQCYPPRGYSGNAISALRLTIDSADEVCKIICRCQR